MTHSQAFGTRRYLPVESLRLVLNDLDGNPLGIWRLDPDDGLWVSEDGQGLDLDEVRDQVLAIVQRKGTDVS